MSEKTGYPLSWPDARPRTPGVQRRHAAFKTPFAIARDNAIREIHLLGGTDIIFSSNIPRRNDGLPHANATPNNGDPGIAAYFTRKGKQLCFACDKWLSVDDNMHAISLTIAALRGIARWGTGDMMEAAFRGFAALPAPGQSSGINWWTVLGVPINATAEQVKDAYRILVVKHHPDKAGDPEMFLRVQQAYDQFETMSKASV
jgi:hypothetical protein